MLRFTTVGCLNTLFDFSIYVLLTRYTVYFREHFLLTNFIAFLVAASFSFVANKYWTFRDRNRRIFVQYPKFLIVSSMGLLLNEGILFFLVRHLDLYDLLAKVFAVGIVMIWNFTANKHWTFRGVAGSHPLRYNGA